MPKRKQDGERSQKKGSSSTLSFSATAHQYARDVVAGTIPNCNWVRMACQRHLDNLAQAKRKEYPYRFDDAKANYVCRYIQSFPHIRGEWARPRFGHSVLLRLEPWQLWIVCCIFGWVDKKTGYRRFSEVLLLVPRKNAKSTAAGAVGNYMHAGDGEFAAEVYAGASTERQAMEVFRTALQMVKRSPEYQRYFGVEFGAKSIYRDEDGSRFVPVVGNPGDGSSPSCAILDEFHEHSSSALVDTMRTGMGARNQPLLLMITTAGSNLAGPCYAMLDTLKKVLEGHVENESLFGVNYTIDDEDDWTTEAALKKANPNYGVSVKSEFLRREQLKAIQSTYLQAIFKTKHLNMWVGSSKGLINMQAWAQCADPSLRIEEFIGQPCYEGVDLAARIDLASRIKVYRRVLDGKAHYYLFGRHYVPHDTAMDGEHSYYAKWIVDGWLTPHEGSEIQLQKIQAEIESELPRYKHECIAFDQYSAQQMQQELEKKVKDGVIITIPQTVQYLSEPLKEVEASVIAGRIHHDGDPVLTWAMSNLVARVDANDNIFPRKERPENKIDPVSALLNAMNRAMLSTSSKQSAGFMFSA
jgi:phage terminase large subunit-like protein